MKRHQEDISDDFDWDDDDDNSSDPWYDRKYKPGSDEFWEDEDEEKDDYEDYKDDNEDE